MSKSPPPKKKMSSAVAHNGHNICPIALAKRLTLLRIDQEGKRRGVVEAYDSVLDIFYSAVIERNSHEEAVDIISHYASRLEHRGKLEEMKRLYRRGIDELRECFGRHHFSTLAVTFRMGELLRRMGEFENAEKMYSESLDGMEDRNPYKLYFFNELGVVYTRRGMLLQAEKAFRHALYGFTHIWGADHLWAYTIAINLSDVYYTKGKLKDAAIMLRRGLLGMTKQPGSLHEVVASKATRFVDFYMEYMVPATWRDARGLCEMALITFEELFGKDDRRTLAVVEDLAIISREQGKRNTLMKRALAGRLESRNHPQHRKLQKKGAAGLLEIETGTRTAQ